jgi:anthranilate synthase component 1
VRAMQIIEELEETPRGLYAGAVGHIGFTGNMDFAIAIRTVIAEGGRLTYRAGAGIVADSVPENEYHETTKKAEGMARAISTSGGAS